MQNLPTPPAEAVLYEDERLYICLASYPLTKGHLVVAWKASVSDLHLLSHDEYEYLMDMVAVAREALRAHLGLEKVYLIYMDELRQVHWHLVPRYDEKGVNILLHEPTLSTDFEMADALRATLRQTMDK